MHIHYIYMHIYYKYMCIHTKTHTHTHIYVEYPVGRQWESEKLTCFFVLFLFFNRQYLSTCLNLGALKSNDILCQWSASWHTFWEEGWVSAVIYNKSSEFTRNKLLLCDFCCPSFFSSSSFFPLLAPSQFSQGYKLHRAKGKESKERTGSGKKNSKETSWTYGGIVVLFSKMNLLIF